VILVLYAERHTEYSELVVEAIAREGDCRHRRNREGLSFSAASFRKQTEETSEKEECEVIGFA